MTVYKRLYHAMEILETTTRPYIEESNTTTDRENYEDEMSFLCECDSSNETGNDGSKTSDDRVGSRSRCGGSSRCC